VGTDAGPGKIAASAPADVLIAAGGDGTVSAVAGVAVDRGLPLVVAPCGTRNHFAADAGFDLADPAANLATADTGVESRVDVGEVNGRIFVNNVSVGYSPAGLRLLGAAGRLAVGGGNGGRLADDGPRAGREPLAGHHRLDGEPTVASSPLVFTCRPGALRLLLPPEPAPDTVRHLTLQD
jgi:diacylglycerol kinase family enzyme